MSNIIEMRVIDNTVSIAAPIVTTEAIKIVDVGPQGIPGPVGSVSEDILSDITDYHNLPNLTLLFENALI